MLEPPLESNQLQLTSQHRISFDRYNKTLSFKYQKRGGKGKSAPLVDEYAYGNEKHFGNFKVLKQRLLEEEFRVGLTTEDISNVDKFIAAVDKACLHVDKVANETYEYIKDKIIINLGESTKGRGRKKIKGVEIVDDEDIDEVDAD